MVQRSQSDELMEAELRYIGPLTRGGTAIMFGVELKVRSDIDLALLSLFKGPYFTNQGGMMNSHYKPIRINPFLRRDLAHGSQQVDCGC